MLYCPKCKSTYEDGSQRFCSADSARLLPVQTAQQKTSFQGGVFSAILNKAAGRQSGAASGEPTFVSSEGIKKPGQVPFIPPPTSKIFKNEPTETDIPVVKPLPRFIKPSDIPSGQAALGNRETHPTGRSALTWETPEVLLGHTVKGRYRITEFLEEDETGFVYLAEDKIVPGKNAVVRVLMDEDERDDLEYKIFAEERVSLSHLDHPNVVRLIDSGELHEGKPFIITEYFKGKTLGELLNSGIQLNALRTARIISQAADALSAAHQNGVLHRNLRPEDIILAVSEKGMEQVKVTNFAVSEGFADDEKLAYQSPEQIAGKSINFASDIYSLAAIAYQMLTARVPFTAKSASEMLKLQREGLTLHPTNMRLDLSPAVDEVLEKALSFNPAERYPKARDFGEAFQEAMTVSSVSVFNDEDAERIEILPIKTEEREEERKIPTPSIPLPASFFKKKEAETPPVIETPEIPVIEAPPQDKTSEKKEEAAEEIAQEKPADDLAWKKRSIEPAKAASSSRAWLSILGVLLLLGITAGVLYYFYTRPQQQEFAATETIAPVEQPAVSEVPVNTEQSAPPQQNIEVPPLPRQIDAPPDSVYFANSKENLSKNLVKDFLAFSLYYPKDWKVNQAETKFIDVSKDASTGTPIEQFMVSPYASNGTFQKDLELFPKLVEESNEDLEKIIPNYRVISEGETVVNNGWRAYEVKFRGEGVTKSGEKITLWGRRMFVPTARPGMQNGFVVTMLATSLSKQVKGADDVGTKGELADILNTFEPDS
ncbi:MAG TPA: serine/threonine-protein kinase, partial [Pyrinomonadaceae bacterium]|nr:serine/threonine-protein kinase [Pyrinomonadaceae bacterium]